MLSREQVEACHRLYRRGALQSFRPGDVVARGFADVGFEEFFILHDGSLLSLTTSRRSELPPTERHAFFLLPSTDDLIAEIERLGGVVSTISRDTERVRWRLCTHTNDAGVHDVDAPSLYDGLLRVVGSLLGFDPFLADGSGLRVGA